jgi:hypothetical protein
MHKKSLVALNLFALACHAISAVLGQLLADVSNPTIEAVAPLVEFSSNNNTTVFIPTPKVIFRTGAFTGLLLFAYITAGFHVVYIVILCSPKCDALVRKYVIDSESTMPLRWIEYAITASILSAWGQLQIGNSSFYFFLQTLSSGIALQAIGLLLEKLDSESQRDSNIAGILWNTASVLNIVPVPVLLYQLFASKTHNQWTFIYNILPYSVWFQSFGIVAWLSFKKYRQFADPLFAEKWYIILSLTTKMTVFWLGFATFQEISVKQGWVPPTKGVNWFSVRMTASYLPVSLVILVALKDYYAWSAPKTGARPPVFGRRKTQASLDL